VSKPSTDQYGSSWWNGVRNWLPLDLVKIASKKKLTASASMIRPAISAIGDCSTKSRYSAMSRQTCES